MKVNFPEMFIQKIKMCSLQHLGRKGLRLGVLKPGGGGKRSRNHSKHKTAGCGEAAPCSGTIHHRLPGLLREPGDEPVSSSGGTEETTQTCPWELRPTCRACLTFSACPPAGQLADQHLPFQKTKQLLMLVYKLTGETWVVASSMILLLNNEPVCSLKKKKWANAQQGSTHGATKDKSETKRRGCT